MAATRAALRAALRGLVVLQELVEAEELVLQLQILNIITAAGDPLGINTKPLLVSLGEIGFAVWGVWGQFSTIDEIISASTPNINNR